MTNIEQKKDAVINNQNMPEILGQKMELISDHDRDLRFKTFINILKPKMDVVYYPCSNNDITPSTSFPNNHIIYVDIDKNVVDSLKSSGYDAIQASATEYNPGPVDILIMLNPVISPQVPISHIAENGYVICNDYHHTATELRENPEFQMKSVIKNTRSGDIEFDMENFDDYWKEVDTEEDFKKSSLDYTKASYSIAASIVKAVTGTRENVYEEYKKIIELAKIQKKDRNDKRKLEKPESANLFEKDNDNDFIIYEFQGRKIPVCTVMPRKGNASSEDFFVFQKNNPAVQ